MEGHTSSPVTQVNHKPINPYAKEQKRLFQTASVAGVGLLLYVACNIIISTLLTANRNILNRYLHEELFTLAVGMVNTTFCVFVPFFIVFAVMRKKNMLQDLPLGKAYDAMSAVQLVFIGMGGCYIANVVTSYLSAIMSAFGIESMTMQFTLSQEPAPLTLSSVLMQILGYAVLPALFEEFAYRGVVLQSLRRYGDWFAIIMSAFVFGILHGNLMQVPFAFIVGIMLGYCTVVSGTMWVGIAIHFGNNLLSVLQSVLTTAYGENAAYACVASVMFTLLIMGIACFVAFSKRNKKFYRLHPNRFRFMQHRTALVLCAPTMLIACAYFLYATLMDIDGFAEWITSGLMNLLRG